jgi:hypothetical protein
MNESDLTFFSTIAQVSATFIGFALLTPIFQVVASGHTTPGEKCILRKKFLMRWLTLILLPIFVLSYPLVVSLLLVRFGINSVISTGLYEWGSIVFGSSVLVLFYKVKKWSKLTGFKELTKSRNNTLFRFLIEWMPFPFIVTCLFMWSISALKFCSSYSHRPHLLLIFLVMIGFLLIIRNIGVKAEEGILFKEIDISPEFRKKRDKFVHDTKEAIKEREKIIEKVKFLLTKYREGRKVEELKKGMGYHKGEIENLRILKNEIKKLYNKVNNEAKVSFVALENFFEFENRRKDGERRIEEFKTGTTIAEKLLESIEGV